MFSSIAPCLSSCLRTASKSPNAPAPGAAAPAKFCHTLPLVSIASNKPWVPIGATPDVLASFLVNWVSAKLVA